MNIYGTVSAPNPASERLHESLGFAHVFTDYKTGWKLGKWHDLIFYRLQLAPAEGEPGPRDALPRAGRRGRPRDIRAARRRDGRQDKMTKTNAMRLLDAAGIAYRTAEYEYDESDLSGKHAAEQLGMPAEQVFKTLVTRGDKTGLLVFCIPVLDELDLRRAAQISGNKKLEMIHVKELLPLTGYMRGGCSPIGMKKKYPTYIDETYILLRRDRRQRGHARRADHPGPGRPREVRGREGILNPGPIRGGRTLKVRPPLSFLPGLSGLAPS